MSHPSLPVSGVGFDHVLGRETTAVALYIQRTAGSENDSIFDHLFMASAQIETTFRHTLVWDRLPNRTGCRVRWKRHHGGWTDPGSWREVIPATVDAMVAFSGVLTAPVLTSAESVLREQTSA